MKIDLRKLWVVVSQNSKRPFGLLLLSSLFMFPLAGFATQWNASVEAQIVTVYNLDEDDEDEDENDDRYETDDDRYEEDDDDDDDKDEDDD
jgi:hypothetical protein